MFKPLSRSNKNAHRPNAGFAETQFLHTSGEDDYSGFAPTEMFEDVDSLLAPAPVVAGTASTQARRAASTSHTALERAAATPAPLPAVAAPAAADEEPAIPQSWITSQWVAAQEAKAHEAANQARAVIAAQRRADDEAEAALAERAPAAPRTGLARLRAAFERLLPGEFKSLLSLFVGVSVTMALISAMLPLLDKP